MIGTDSVHAPFDDPRTDFEKSHRRCLYPFPLADGRYCSLTLPENLTADDAERLVAFIETLIVTDEVPA